MNFKAIPFKAIRDEITRQAKPEVAFKNILLAAKKKCPALDWKQFSLEYMDTDINATARWIKKTLKTVPDAKGIYLGLDTLNMRGGKGSNVEIGMNTDCDPAVKSMDWAYRCDAYGKNHLIKGLYRFFAKFKGPEDDNKDLAEYIVFLSYSGLVIREALLKVDIKNDFISCWGFHDGDLFLLMNKVGQKTTFLANKKIPRV